MEQAFFEFRFVVPLLLQQHQLQFIHWAPVRRRGRRIIGRVVGRGAGGRNRGGRGGRDSDVVGDLGLLLQHVALVHVHGIDRTAEHRGSETVWGCVATCNGSSEECSSSTAFTVRWCLFHFMFIRVRLVFLRIAVASRSRRGSISNGSKWQHMSTV